MIITRTETIGGLIIPAIVPTFAGGKEITYASPATPTLSFRC